MPTSYEMPITVVHPDDEKRDLQEAKNDKFQPIGPLPEQQIPLPPPPVPSFQETVDEQMAFERESYRRTIASLRQDVSSRAKKIHQLEAELSKALGVSKFDPKHPSRYKYHAHLRDMDDDDPIKLYEEIDEIETDRLKQDATIREQKKQIQSLEKEVRDNQSDREMRDGVYRQQQERVRRLKEELKVSNSKLVAYAEQQQEDLIHIENLKRELEQLRGSTAVVTTTATAPAINNNDSKTETKRKGKKRKQTASSSFTLEGEPKKRVIPGRHRYTYDPKTRRPPQENGPYGIEWLKTEKSSRAAQIVPEDTVLVRVPDRDKKMMTATNSDVVFWVANVLEVNGRTGELKVDYWDYNGARGGYCRSTDRVSQDVRVDRKFIMGFTLNNLDKITPEAHNKLQSQASGWCLSRRS